MSSYNVPGTVLSPTEEVTDRLQKSRAYLVSFLRWLPEDEVDLRLDYQQMLSWIDESVKILNES